MPASTPALLTASHSSHLVTSRGSHVTEPGPGVCAWCMAVQARAGPVQADLMVSSDQSPAECLHVISGLSGLSVHKS